MIYSVTNRCNLHCKGCYAVSKTETNHNELSVERVRNLFKEASDLGVGVVMIAGGEPLMRPEILWAASEQRDIIFPIFTNGLLLDEESISYFKYHKNLVPILSIEGKQHFTDARRGPGVYAKLTQKMEQLNQSRSMSGISITLTRENFEEVTSPVWIQNHFNLGSQLFFFVEYVPQSEADLSLCLTKEQKEKLQPWMKQIRKQLPALFISLPGDEQQFGGCLAAGRGFIHISSEGNLEPCPFAPYSDINIRDKSLEKALQSPFLHRIRQSHHLFTETAGGCTLWENRTWTELQLEASVKMPA